MRKTNPIKNYLLLVILLSSQALVLGIPEEVPRPANPISKPPYSSSHKKLVKSWIKDGRITLPSLQRINTENLVKPNLGLDQRHPAVPADCSEPRTDEELRNELVTNLRGIELKVIRGELPKEALEVMRKTLETKSTTENLPDLAKLVRDQAASASYLYSFEPDSSDPTKTVPDLTTHA